MIRRTYAVLDVFTDTPLQGNPVAVFLDALDLPTEVMQDTARELNLSESVFMGPIDPAPEAGGAHAEARIFTPSAELPFAGHPTLGAAFLIRDHLGLGDGAVGLALPAGRIPITFSGELGEMEQPLPEEVELTDPEGVLAALGIREPVDGPAAYSNGPVHVYVEVRSVAELSAVRPDLARLAEFDRMGFTVYARAGAAGQYRSRMFAPGLGVPEDPATGSAAGPLAAHLVLAGREASGETLRIEQGVEMGRPSLLLARAEAGPGAGGGEIRRVGVAGQAVIVGRGDYRLG